MKRRSFLKVLGVGSAAVVTGSTVSINTTAHDGVHWGRSTPTALGGVLDTSSTIIRHTTTSDKSPDITSGRILTVGYLGFSTQPN
jgi:hypothetical protein